VLAEGIRAVAAGKTIMRPAVTEPVRARIRTSELSFDAHSAPDRLTPRETEVMRLIAAGMGNREIAGSLGLVEGTVKNHISSVLSKLGVRDRTRAVLKAIERGDL
jgi:DNA-binding NarL/FixJ family response regulator